MSRIPRTRTPDSTLALLSEGYTFIPRRCHRLDTDIFRTRLMLRPVVCMQGEDAARQFYTPDRFTRSGAMPFTTLMLLQDFGSVQLQEGDAHRHRKALFMSVLGKEKLGSLVDLFSEEWHIATGDWVRRNEVVLNDEMESVLTRAVCRWTGIPLGRQEAGKRTRELAAMIGSAGRVGPKNWWALLLRERTERWAMDLIERIRSGALQVADRTAVHALAWHRSENGEPLEVRTAAVELLNLLRPTVAVARYITFAALALYEHPQLRRTIQSGGNQVERFVQEVRRYYPFFPFIGGRAIDEFQWRGHHFRRGDWVMLDLYGTNHDPRIWEEPHVFWPDRFQAWEGNPWTLIPQGAGDHSETHRCPGEWATIDLMKRAVELLVNDIHYEVPPQHLHIDLARMPALPRSGFVIANVRRTG